MRSVCAMKRKHTDALRKISKRLCKAGVVFVGSVL